MKWGRCRLVDTKTLTKSAGIGDKEALIQLVMAQKEEYYRLAYTYMGNKAAFVISWAGTIIPSPL